MGILIGLTFIFEICQSTLTNLPLYVYRCTDFEKNIKYVYLWYESVGHDDLLICVELPGVRTFHCMSLVLGRMLIG
jgi:hypothetical protein